MWLLNICMFPFVAFMHNPRSVTWIYFWSLMLMHIKLMFHFFIQYKTKCLLIVMWGCCGMEMFSSCGRVSSFMSETCVFQYWKWFTFQWALLCDNRSTFKDVLHHFTSTKLHQIGCNGSGLHISSRIMANGGLQKGWFLWRVWLVLGPPLWTN